MRYESIIAVRRKNFRNRGQIGACQGLGMDRDVVVIKVSGRDLCEELVSVWTVVMKTHAYPGDGCIQN